MRNFLKTLGSVLGSLGGLAVFFKLVVWFLNAMGYLQTVEQIAGWIPWKRINESSWWIAPVICVASLILILIVGRWPENHRTRRQLGKISDLLDSEIEKGRKQLSSVDSRPRFSIESGPKVKDSYSMNWWAENVPVRFLHPILLVDGMIPNCKGYLTQITNNKNADWTGQEQLTWSPAEAHDHLIKTLHPGMRYPLDVLAVTSNRTLHVCNENRDWRRWPRLHNIFSEPGDYFLTVAIVGDGVTAQTFRLRFEWTLNLQTSFLHSQGLISTNDQLSRRTIRFDQESQIIKLLKGVPLRPIWITTRWGSRENDKETYDYAMQLTRAFMKAGVPIEGRASIDTVFPTGVSLFWNKAIYNDVTASSIIEAVRITGLECKEADRQVCSSDRKEPEINLMIGANEVTRVSSI
jgi:hypothetical protein